MIIENPRRSPMAAPVQLLVFIAIVSGLLIVGNILGLAAVYMFYGFDTIKNIMHLDLSAPLTVSALWLIQIFGTTLPILFTPVVFGRFIMREPDAYLQVRKRFSPVLLLFVFAIMVMSTPIMEVLVNVNQKMVLPEFLKGIEDWMRRSEEEAQRITNVLLKMPTIWHMFKSLLLVGLITAIAEELMFRGCLQTIFVRWTNNIHVAIWITATLFSAFHMEFFGFLPRLMLGVLFGYFVAWSGSVWPAVWAHFLNNGSAVVLTYLYQNGKLHDDPNTQHVFSYALYVFSIIITVALLWNYRAVALNKQQSFLD